MTPAERQRRHRQRVREQWEKVRERTPDLDLRRELFNFIERMEIYGHSPEEIAGALDDACTFCGIRGYRREHPPEGWSEEWENWRFLSGEGLFGSAAKTIRGEEWEF